MSVNRWRIIVLLMDFAAIGHFNRLGISVAWEFWLYVSILCCWDLGSAHAITTVADRSHRASNWRSWFHPPKSTSVTNCSWPAV